MYTHSTHHRGHTTRRQATHSLKAGSPVFTGEGKKMTANGIRHKPTARGNEGRGGPLERTHTPRGLYAATPLPMPDKIQHGGEKSSAELAQRPATQTSRSGDNSQWWQEVKVPRARRANFVPHANSNQDCPLSSSRSSSSSSCRFEASVAAKATRSTTP